MSSVLKRAIEHIQEVMQLQKRSCNYWEKEWRWIISIIGSLVRKTPIEYMYVNARWWLYLFMYLLSVTDNMPVTWCYQLEDERQYCSTGFPMGCYSKEPRSQQDTCTIHVSTELSRSIIFRLRQINLLILFFFIHTQGPYNKVNTYYLFNHVNLTITYHSGATEEWGSAFKENGGRIICEFSYISETNAVFTSVLITRKRKTSIMIL